MMPEWMVHALYFASGVVAVLLTALIGWWWAEAVARETERGIRETGDR